MLVSEILNLKKGLVMKLLSILGFLLIALSVPLATYIGTLITQSPDLEQRTQKLNILKKLYSALEKQQKKSATADELSGEKEAYTRILADPKLKENQEFKSHVEQWLTETQKNLVAIEQEEKKNNGTSIGEQALQLVINIKASLGKFYHFLSLVSLIVFASILFLSHFFKSVFLRNSLLSGALATLLLGITSNLLLALIITPIILYTTRKMYQSAQALE